MAYLSSHTVLVDQLYPEQLELIKLFQKANSLPDVLATHNSSLMQQAFLSVAQDSWVDRLFSLENALQTRNTTEGTRKYLVISKTTNLPEHIERLLDRAFLAKYDELIEKVKYDYDGFFPYKVDRYSQQILVFKKLPPEALTQYILTFNR